MTSKWQVALHVIAVTCNYLILAGDIPVPPNVKPYVMLAIGLAQGFVGWYGHYYNPDGTPATVAWNKK